MNLLLMVSLSSCQRHTPPTGERASSGSTRLLPKKEVVPTRLLSFPKEDEEANPRLTLRLLPGEFTLAPPPSAPSHYPLDEDAADSLLNMAMAPEDLANGWEWAWDVFRNLPSEDRPAFVGQIASLTPAWAWDRLDPILDNPAWGTEVLQALWRRLLDLPMENQLPRILRIAQNSSHPCHDQAASILRAYFPEISPGRYDEYYYKISPPATP
jgi:hypothetical protein